MSLIVINSQGEPGRPGDRGRPGTPGLRGSPGEPVSIII